MLNLLQVRITFRDSPAVIKEWEDFGYYSFPQSDNVEDYVKEHPLHIPLFDLLFSESPPTHRAEPMQSLISLNTTNLLKVRVICQ